MQYISYKFPGQHLRRILTFTALILGLSSPAMILADDAQNTWTQWRGPNRDGSIDGHKIPASISEESLKLDWRVELEPSYSSPVIANGMVFTTETANKENEVVKAFDVKTGKLIWEKSWQGSMKVPFFAASNGSWIRSTPAFADGQLLVGGMRDVLKCLDASNGNVVWEIDFPFIWETKLPTFGFVSSPLVDGNDVYVQAGAAFVKINKTTGNITWKTLEDKGGMSDSAFSSPTIAEIHGVRQLVVQTREELAGVSLNDGSVFWKTKVPSYRGMNILTPLIHNNQIFTSSYKNRSWLYEVTKTGDNWDVKEKWEAKSPAYMSSPVLIDGHIYMHLQSQRIQCLDWNSGESKWISEQSFGKYWSMIASDNRILALDEKGDLLVISPTPEMFNLIERRKISENDTWAHIALAGNQIFVRELNALAVYSFDPQPDLAKTQSP